MRNPETVASIAEVVAALVGVGGLAWAAGEVVSSLAILGGALLKLAPLAIPFLIIVSLIGAYETNFGGFRDFVDALGKGLRDLGPAGGIAVLGLIPVGIWITKMAANAAITTIASGVSQLAVAFAALATPLFVVLAPLLLVGILFAAYENNVLGFRDAVNSLGNALRRLADAFGLVNSRANLPGGKSLLEKLIPGFKNPFLDDGDLGRETGRKDPKRNGLIPLPPGPGSTRLPLHDYPGPAYAGTSYAIGTQEVFTPNTNGYITPLGGAKLGGDTYNFNGPIMVGAVATQADIERGKAQVMKWVIEGKRKAAAKV
jgi:hypothetical protein